MCDLYERLWNLKYWFYIIWNNKPYHSWYLYTIIQHHIKYMNMYDGNDIFENEMKNMIDVLERLKQDKYTESNDKEHDLRKLANHFTRDVDYWGF